MLHYIMTNDESKCCGCGACKEICPQKAISLFPNEEGFMYPILDQQKCIDCGICDKVCPEMHIPEGKKPKGIFAIQNKNKQKLFRSSSGGAFRLIADEIVNEGGFVVGCVWNTRLEPVLSLAHNLHDLEAMQGSKYLASSTEHTYTETKRLLDSDKKVLFTGTPCQCAGLLNFLKKPYENLLTMDFLCHGVPSQYAFNAYRVYCQKKHKNSNIESIQFRDKKKHGWAISESYIINGKRYYAHGLTSTYLYGFINGYFNRYSCYTCNFRGENRFTDFTICDFWGYEKYHNTLNAHSGISALQINSEKGRYCFNSVKENAFIHETSRQYVSEENPTIINAEEEQIPAIRKKIYKQIQLDGWESIAKRTLRCKNYFLRKIWYSIPDGIVRNLKHLLHI